MSDDGKQWPVEIRIRYDPERAHVLVEGHVENFTLALGALEIAKQGILDKMRAKPAVVVPPFVLKHPPVSEG